MRFAVVELPCCKAHCVDGFRAPAFVTWLRGARNDGHPRCGKIIEWRPSQVIIMLPEPEFRRKLAGFFVQKMEGLCCAGP